MADTTTGLDVTQRLTRIKELPEIKPETSDNGSVAPKPEVEEAMVASKELVIPQPKAPTKREIALNKRRVAAAQMLKERFRQIGLALFVEGQAVIRSVGITSAIEGEGKSFVATVIAQVVAEDNMVPVTLIECNWHHPSLHEHYKLAATPGLAEWLRGECGIADIQHEVGKNLTVIPAGNGKADAARLLQQLRQQSLQSTFSQADGIFILDLPPVLTTAYGSLAARVSEALLMVTRAGVTPAPMLEEALGHLNDLQVKSIILNQVESKIPQWIRQLL